ncbi:MAG: 3-hydroxyacyl-CoA dehydrogenase family protein, partial [Micromonosporaceae bacterium]
MAPADALPPTGVRRQIHRVGVIGGGATGAAIAVEFAIHKRHVVVCNRTDKSSAAAEARVAQALRLLVESGLISSIDRIAALDRIQHTTALADAVTNSDYIVEATPEDLAVKRQIFHAIDTLAAPDVLIASNTTGLPITAIASDCAHPHRTLTVHSYLPSYLIPLVDIVAGDHTALEAVDVARKLMTDLGKSPVVFTKDTLGTPGARLQAALIAEGFRIVADGLATPETVDQVITMGIGRRFGVSGVFDRLDIAGLDTVAAVFQQQQRPLPPVLAEKVATGELGAKTGKGFYRWRAEDITNFDHRETRHLAGHLHRDRSPGTAVRQPAASEVLFDPRLLDPFLAAALAEYQGCTPEQPPSCFAVLVGRWHEGSIRVEQAHFGANVRASDPSATAEFSDAVVPCFGDAYANPCRGF